MTPALYQQSRGPVLAVFGVTTDRAVERNYYVQQAQAKGATLDGFYLKYPDGRREWCDYDHAHEVRPVQGELFSGELQ